MRIRFVVVGLAIAVALLLTFSLGLVVRDVIDPPATPLNCLVDLLNPPTAESIACYRGLLERGYKLCPSPTTTHPDWLELLGDAPECADS